MEGNFVKSIKVKKLHGMYDLNIDFDKDISIIYGSNGKGKTTILNINY